MTPPHGGSGAYDAYKFRSPEFRAVVNALRGLLVDAPANLWADFAVLVGAAVIGVVGAAALLGRLVR